MTEPPSWKTLTEQALEARLNAYAPYSQFSVGAAVATDHGDVFGGCNVENRSYGMTICAERTAVVAAVRAGARRFARVVVVADTTKPARPCGLCLDTLAEFSGPDLEIRVVTLDGSFEQFELKDLLPSPFSRDDLP